jgi:hypothetical protein
MYDTRYKGLISSQSYNNPLLISAAQDITTIISITDIIYMQQQ